MIKIGDKVVVCYGQYSSRLDCLPESFKTTIVGIAFGRFVTLESIIKGEFGVLTVDNIKLI